LGRVFFWSAEAKLPLLKRKRSLRKKFFFLISFSRPVIIRHAPKTGKQQGMGITSQAPLANLKRKLSLPHSKVNCLDLPLPSILN
jgi:hypothetical protein